MAWKTHILGKSVALFSILEVDFEAEVISGALPSFLSPFIFRFPHSAEHIGGSSTAIQYDGCLSSARFASYCAY